MIYKINRYGAKTDGSISTAAIQKAIDDCFENGGGTVVVPMGDYVTGGLRIRSGVRLHLEKNAHLIGSRNPDDYLGFLNDKLEPVKEEDKTNDVWRPCEERSSYNFMTKCAGKWNNALIRAIDAENIAITGEKGSYIDGKDCFDEKGEENYRGPHAINFHRCKNIKLSGYKIQNSANWAHALFDCDNIKMDNVIVEAGHDGCHFRNCKNIRICKCEFYTGDDAVAGFANLNVVVRDCIVNTACNGFRFGGTNVLIERCCIFGPGKFLHRLSLSDGEKREGKRSESRLNHRFNTLSAFTYFACLSHEIEDEPGNIVIKDCNIDNVKYFINYNFDHDVFQNNKPTTDITIKNITAKNIHLPITMCGSNDVPVKFKITDSDIEFAVDRATAQNDNESVIEEEFIKADNFAEILLENVNIDGFFGNTLIKSWSKKGEIVCKNLHCNNFSGAIRTNVDEKYECETI